MAIPRELRSWVEEEAISRVLDEMFRPAKYEVSKEDIIHQRMMRRLLMGTPEALARHHREGVAHPETMSQGTYIALHRLHRTLCSVSPQDRDHDVLFELGLLLGKSPYTLVEGKGCVLRSTLAESDIEE